MSNLLASATFDYGQYQGFCVEFFQAKLQTEYLLLDSFVEMQTDKIENNNGSIKLRKACKELGYEKKSSVDPYFAWRDVVRINTWGKKDNSENISIFSTIDDS